MAACAYTASCLYFALPGHCLVISVQTMLEGLVSSLTSMTSVVGLNWVQVHASGTWQPRPVHMYYQYGSSKYASILCSPAIVPVGDENVNLLGFTDVI